jgi:hypothetical protein
VEAVDEAGAVETAAALFGLDNLRRRRLAVRSLGKSPQEHPDLWNRIITLTCFVAGFAGGAIYFLTLIPEARRSTRLVQQKVAVSVVPMVVEITSSMSSYGMTTYYFSYDDGGRTRKTQNVMRKDEPFVVGKKGAHALALALLAAHGGRPILS